MQSDHSTLQRPPSLAALAAERLKKAIENAEFELGASLSEDKLATYLGVSRTPVREALNSLNLQGLVEIYPQRGSYVFSPSQADVDQLCEFRMMMESRALGLCLTRSKNRTLQKLKEANERMQRACDAQDRMALAENDTAFHMALFEECGNAFLQQAYALVAGRITALRTHLVNPATGISPHAIKEHAEIIDAFGAEDLVRAESLLSTHMYKMAKNYANWRASVNEVVQTPSTAKRRKK